jgi:hypothetical protein
MSGNKAALVQARDLPEFAERARILEKSWAQPEISPNFGISRCISLHFVLATRAPQQSRAESFPSF